MSSRGEFVGSGPTAGIYQPRPIPLDTEDLPVYINDELLQLGGRLNEIFEGGAFPPQGELPQRWRDGMMVYFISELPDKYPNGDRKDEQIITSAGVWLYKQEEWWKIIDDPSAIVGGVYVYKLTPDGTAPATPLDSPEVPPDGWLETPPEKADKIEYIWVSTLAGLNDTSGVHTWSVPTIWSAGVDEEELEGGSAEQRFLAGSADTVPVIDDVNERYPSSGGVDLTLTIPPTSPPSVTMIYVSSASIGSITDEIKVAWSEMVPFSTPDNTQNTRAWATAANWDSPYPAFSPTEEGLPGPDWTYEQPAENRSRPLWMTERLEFLNGKPQTVWTTPVLWGSEQGTGSEFRYIIWPTNATAPVVADPSARSPTESGGTPFTLDIPPTDGDFPYVYQVHANIGVETDELMGTWGAAVLYATPDTSGYGRCWATAATWDDVYPPFTPEAEGLPGPDWTRLEDAAQPPYTRDYPVWVSDRIEWTDETRITNWTTPARWNTEKGIGGVPGVPGDNGLRGTVNLLDPTDRTVWTDQAAWDLVTAHVAGQTDPKNQVPIVGDIVTQQDKTSTSSTVFVESRSLTTAVAPGTWLIADQIIDGNLIVQGTITGEDIYASSRITIGSGEEVVILDGTSTEARIWVGSQTATSGNFMVDPSGNMSCNNATFAGDVTSGSTITGATITGGQMTVGTGFTVDTAGTLTATGASINGTLAADSISTTSGNFSVDTGGNMACTNATFAGNVTSTATITGGSVNSAQMNSANGAFIVDSVGNMTCQDATINGTLNGPLLSDGGVIVGSEIHVPTIIPQPVDLNFSGTHIYSDGSLFASDGIFNGTIYAAKMYGDVNINERVNPPVFYYDNMDGSGFPSTPWFELRMPGSPGADRALRFISTLWSGGYKLTNNHSMSCETNITLDIGDGVDTNVFSVNLSLVDGPEADVPWESAEGYTHNNSILIDSFIPANTGDVVLKFSTLSSGGSGTLQVRQFMGDHDTIVITDSYGEFSVVRYSQDVVDNTYGYPLV